MTILTATTLEFEAEASSENLGEIAPNSILMIVADQTGKKQVFRLNADGIQENATLLHNTTTGMCLKYINGQWVWAPC